MIRAQKKITLDQLQAELQAAGLDVSAGLGMIGDWVFPWDSDKKPDTFKDEVVAKSTIDAHVAMREVTNEELNVAYAEANNNNDHQKMQNLVAMAHGLVPRIKVPL